MLDDSKRFYEYNNILKYNNISFKSKCYTLVLFFQKLNKLKKVKSQKKHTKNNEKIVYKKASKLYNELLRTPVNEYVNFLPSIQLILDPDYVSRNLFFNY